MSDADGSHVMLGGDGGGTVLLIVICVGQQLLQQHHQMEQGYPQSGAAASTVKGSGSLTVAAPTHIRHGAV